MNDRDHTRLDLNGSRRSLLKFGTKGLGALAATSAFSACHATSPRQEDLDVPFITTPDNVVLTILEMAKVGPSDFVLDLGSGDGRIPITAAKRFGASALGVEIDPRLVGVSKDNAKLAGVERSVDFRVQDLFDTE